MTHTQPVVQYGKFETQVRRLPNIFEQANYKLNRANGTAAMTTTALFGEDHALGTALFQSVYVSVSILRRTLKLSEDDTANMLRDALANPIRSLGPISQRMLSGLH
jgi:hypothetical protein